MMEQIAKKLDVKYKKNGVKRLEILDQTKLKQLELNIFENAVGALCAPTGVVVCPHELNIVAISNAIDNGIHLKLKFEVKCIVGTENGYEMSSNTENYLNGGEMLSEITKEVASAMTKA